MQVVMSASILLARNVRANFDKACRVEIWRGDAKGSDPAHQTGRANFPRLVCFGLHLKITDSASTLPFS
jgi:hypothetical protein